jgi:hypothetical protein
VEHIESTENEISRLSISFSSRPSNSSIAQHPLNAFFETLRNSMNETHPNQQSTSNDDENHIPSSAPPSTSAQQQNSNDRIPVNFRQDYNLRNIPRKSYQIQSNKTRKSDPR